MTLRLKGAGGVQTASQTYVEIIEKNAISFECSNRRSEHSISREIKISFSTFCFLKVSNVHKGLTVQAALGAEKFRLFAALFFGAPSVLKSRATLTDETARSAHIFRRCVSTERLGRGCVRQGKVTCFHCD